MGAFTSKSSSKKSSAQITKQDQVILSLKTQRNKLNGEQKLLETRIDRHQEVARQLLHEGRRDRALMALKKKKLTEKQLEQLSAHILNVEGMLNNIESMKHQTRVFEVLQKGNDALKELQKQVAIDDVRKLMEDTAEAHAYQDELNQVLGQSLTSVDDQAVAAEMEALEAEQLRAEVASMPVAPLPTPAEAAALKAAQQKRAAEQAAAAAAAAAAARQGAAEKEQGEIGRREAMLAA